MRFLLVEDNDELASAILERLSINGHVVDHASDIAAAEGFSSSLDYDLILLDIMLPDGDGRDYLHRHRRQNDKTPVIVLTARSEVSDRVSVLDLGADDYLTKPFDFSELEARCRAVLRRHVGETSNAVSLADVTFDALAGTINVGSTTTQLRNKEMRLMEIFVNTPDQIYSKTKLMDRLFGYDEDVSENAIEVYVGRLRKHLKDSRVQIITVRGVGYKLRVNSA